MKVTSVAVTPSAPGKDKKTKGFANVTLDNSLMIRGILIFENLTGLHVKFPGIVKPNGQWVNTVLPIQSALQEEIETHILARYTEIMRESTALC